MTAAPIAAAPEHRQDPSFAAAGWLIAAYAVVVLVAAVLHAGGNWIRTPPTITVPASRMELARGTGQRTADAVIVSAADPRGVAVVSVRGISLAADTYPRVQWELLTADPGAAAQEVTLSLVWTTREQPGRTFSALIPWPTSGPAVIVARDHEAWRGTITGLALAMRGTLPQPVAVTAVVVPGVSLPAEIGAMLRQWTTFHAFGGTSITQPFDEERTHAPSLLAATAFALGAAMIAYALVARSRKRRPDARVLWTLLVAGWLILDLRWQANLGWQLARTAGQFAGRTIEEKYQASTHHELYALVRRALDALPPPPVRVHFLSDNPVLRMRGSWYLYPHNVYHDLGRVGQPQVPTPDELRSGDHVVMLLDTTLSYDRAGRAIVWPDGQRKAVDELLFENPGPVVLRVR